MKVDWFTILHWCRFEKVCKESLMNLQKNIQSTLRWSLLMHHSLIRLRHGITSWNNWTCHDYSKVSCFSHASQEVISHLRLENLKYTALLAFLHSASASAGLPARGQRDLAFQRPLPRRLNLKTVGLPGLEGSMRLHYSHNLKFHRIYSPTCS